MKTAKRSLLTSRLHTVAAAGIENTILLRLHSGARMENEHQDA